MIRALLPEGNPTLKIPATMLPPSREVAISVATDLIDTMIHHDALGLAAVQIGLSYRGFAMVYGGDNIVCFGPSYTVVEDAPILHSEGCLSFPGLHLQIRRPPAIEARWTDQYGVAHQQTLTGYEAYAFQHEQDHLDGITFDAHVSRLVLNMAKKKRAKHVQ